MGQSGSRPNLTSNASFISDITDDTLCGRSFVPFLGSGLSSPSGIITGQEFTKYLTYVLYLVLGKKSIDAKSFGWSLRKQGWPPYPGDLEVREAIAWIRTEFERICSRYNWDVTYEKEENIFGKNIKGLSLSGDHHERDLYESMAKPPVPLILRSTDYRDQPDRFRKMLESFHMHTSPNEYPESIDFEDYILDRSMSYEEQMVEKGIRSLADWKQTLVFLSRVRFLDDNSGRKILDPIDTNVIDTFNIFITAGRKPSLGHKILAQLSKPLRFRTILTTNFDKLIEAAYEEIGNNLAVLPVSKKGELPQWEIVGATDTLVKLHGESQDTRSDLTLDEEPTNADKKTFTAYLTRFPRPLSLTNHEIEKKSNHRSDRLLVIGYSGNDHRCVQLIKHWLETGQDNPRVYWVCFNDYDVKRVQTLFSSKKYADKVMITQTPRPELLLFELYQRVELTLPPGGPTYEFLHAAPPSQRGNPITTDESGHYESANLPSRTNLVWKHGKAEVRKTSIHIIRKAIEELVLKNQWSPNEFEREFALAVPWEPSYVGKKIHTIDGNRRTPWIVHGATGIAQAASLAYNNLSKNHYKKVFWFELDSQLDADALLREFLRMLAVRFGDFMVNHVTMHPEGFGRIGDIEQSHSQLATADKELNCEKLYKNTVNAKEAIAKHIRETLDRYNADVDSIVVMLYARDSYGHNAGIQPVPGNWNESKSYGLHLLIDAISTAGVPIIYFPLLEGQSNMREYRIRETVRNLLPTSQTKAIQIKKPVNNQILHDKFSDDIIKHHKQDEHSAEIYLLGNDTSMLFESLENLFRSATFLNLSNPDSFKHLDKRQEVAIQFLYALTLFRSARHPSSLMVESVLSCPFRYNRLAMDNDFFRSRETSILVRELIDLNIFFEKPGGLLWFNGEIRRCISSVLENLEFEVINLSDSQSGKHDPQQRKFKLEHRRSKIHFWIADWYMKAFLSSGHISPLIESTYHLVSSAYWSDTARYRTAGTDSEKQLEKHRCDIFKSSLLQACRNILIGWNRIEFWQASSVEVSWLSQIETIQCSLSESLAKIVGQEKLDDPNSFPSEKGALDSFEITLKNLSHAIQLTGGSSRRTLKLDASRHLFRVGPKKPKASLEIDHDMKYIAGTEETGLADYVEDLFAKLSQGLEEIPRSIDFYCSGEITISKLGEIKASIRDKVSKSNIFEEAIWLLTECAYLYLRRAKVKYHAKRISDLRLWLKCSIFCSLGLDFCKNLPSNADSFEMLYKGKLQGIYGVALASLGRFNEANRHLVDAQSISRSSKVATQLDSAILKIRQAEFFLTKCFWKVPILESSAMNIKSYGEGNSESGDTGENQGLSNCPSSLYIVDFLPTEVSRRNPGTNSKFIFREKFLSKFSEQCNSVGEVHLMRDDLYSFGSDFIKCRLESEEQLLFLPATIEDVFHKTIPYSLKYQLVESESTDRGPLLSRWHSDFKNEIQRQFVADLDDAALMLESAENLLQGESHNSHWWFQLRLVQLRTYGLLKHIEYYADQSLVFRRYGAFEGIQKSFDDAWRIAGQDDFRRVRSFRYLLEAVEWALSNAIQNGLQDVYSEKIRSLFRRCKSSHDILSSRCDNTRQSASGLGTGLLFEIWVSVDEMYKDIEVLMNGLDLR
jgi:hypothetical protein